jgi:hypothetical protein
MRITVRPVVDPQREIDLTNQLVAAIAEELWRLYGGNDKLNWIEAERHLQRIVGEARAEARAEEPEPAAKPVRQRVARGVRVPHARRRVGRSTETAKR